MAKKSKSKKEISREELSSAMKQFMEKGGKIKVLPPEKTLGQRSIGGAHLSAFESLSELENVHGG